MVGYDLPGLVCVRRVNDGFSRDLVFVALRVSDGEEVAVRVYDRRLSDEHDRTRFTEEVAAITGLADQDHVLAPREAGVSADGKPYVVTEYCVAGSMHDHLTTVGRFTPTEARRIGAKVASALGAVHERGIVHRNVKPANILINAVGEPALTDFAIVSLETASGDYALPTAPTQRAYAAPEAFLPELMSAKTDIYSLGATLYALLAGWAPRAADPLAIVIDGETLVDLPKVPWALMQIVRRAMAIDPQERYRDAYEFSAALASA
jgi:serine/threonine protein kinase